MNIKEVDCGKCGKTTKFSEAEGCWYCNEILLCADCWEEWGHCGHSKAYETNTKAHVARIKDLEADLLTASTRDTAQLELIGKLEAENKELKRKLNAKQTFWICPSCGSNTDVEFPEYIAELQTENKRLREAGNFLSSEYVEVVESNCDCERYTDVIGQVEEAVTKELFSGMSLPIKCGLCEWADALSKDS